MSFVVLMPAAGVGDRLGMKLPKGLVRLGDWPLFVWSAEVFVQHPDCEGLILAVPRAARERFLREVKKHLADYPVELVDGGETRQESVGHALEAVDKDVELVLVHDAARPFIEESMINRVIEGVDDRCVAVVPALEIMDSVKRQADNGPYVRDSLPRDHLHLAQTPQAIQTAVLRRAHELAARDGFVGTDDVALVERFKLGTTRIVPGSPDSFKITTKDDLLRARRMID